MNRVFKALAIAFTVVVALVSCKKEDQPKEVALTGIELNATTQALQVGQEFQLTVTYKPENATTKPAATWASDTPAVATVDAGKVVAVAAGTAKITATVGTFTASCTVTVTSAEEEILPVEGNSEWSIIGALLGANWDKDFVAAKDGDIYVVKNVKLVASDQFKFRKDKDWGVNRGAEGDVEPFKLTAGTAITVVHNGKNLSAPGDGIYDIYYNAAVEQVCLVAKDGTPSWNEPQPQGALVMDGDPSDWAELDAANVVSLELPADAEKTGLKSAKAYYDDKLYILVELSEATLADSKARLHVYFDSNNTGLLKQNSWAKSTIDYVTEGKMHADGAYATYGSPLYATLQESWGCTDTGFTPAYESAGADSFYELSMDFSEAPAEIALPVAFNLGVDVVYSDWGCYGFLPQEEKLARIVKVGATDPGEDVGPVEMDWDYTPSAAYLADTNLWKAADADNTITFLYHPNWADPTVEPTAEFKESTYVLTLMDADAGNAYSGQMIITPNNDVIVDPAKTYNFSCTIGSSTGTSVWIKMHQPGVNWPEVFETAGAEAVAERIAIAAGETKEIKIEGIKSMYEEALPQELLFDFAPHSANNTIYIKDIIFEEVGGETPPAGGNITLDGNFDDWADIEAQTPWASISEWKVSSDSENLFFYFKIKRSGIKAESSADDTGLWPFDHRRYMAMIFDVDNNAETGGPVEYAGMNRTKDGVQTVSLPGVDAWGIIYPFRGHADAKEGKDGELLIVNGVDNYGAFALVADGDDSPEEAENGVHGAAYGNADAVVDGGYAYFEVGVPLAGLGNPAAGTTINFQLSFSWDVNTAISFTL